MGERCEPSLGSIEAGAWGDILGSVMRLGCLVPTSEPAGQAFSSGHCIWTVVPPLAGPAASHMPVPLSPSPSCLSEMPKSHGAP